METDWPVVAMATAATRAGGLREWDAERTELLRAEGERATSSRMAVESGLCAVLSLTHFISLSRA